MASSTTPLGGMVMSFLACFALRIVNRDGRLDFAGEVAGDLERNGDVLAQEAVSRHGNIFQNQVRHGGFAAHRHGENGNVLLAITGGGGERGFAHVPIPVGQKQDGLEILETLQSLLQGGVEVRAVDGVGVGGRRGKVFHHHLGLALAGAARIGARRLASSHWARLTTLLVSVRSRVFMLSEASMRMAISGVTLRWRRSHVFRPQQGEDEQRHQ